MFNAIKLYRLGHFLYTHNIPVLPKVLYYLNYLIFNSSIPMSAAIGPDTTFAYGGVGVVIHSKAVIGKNVMIGQGITIGGNFGATKNISIGDNVYIGAGSRIINSTIGNNVVIGANSVISSKTIPDNVVVAGVPARIISDFNPNFHRWGAKLK